MNCKLFIDKTRDEEVQIFAHKESSLTDAIQKLVEDNNTEIIGYIDSQAIILDLLTVNCFVVENSKVYALTDKDKLSVRLRLYQLEEKLPETFLKVNQSCIANIRQIKSFDASFTGSMLINFKNGYNDFVSRRQLKSVKERLGL